MICPHCGHKNPEERKYCRGCAKMLALPPAAAEPAPLTDEQRADSTPVDLPAIKNLDPFADDASFEPSSAPAVSPKVIAIAAVLIAVIAGAVFSFMHKSARDQDAQAAQAQSTVNNVAYHPIVESPENHEHLLAALHLIVAQQEARLADDPDDLNVCAVNVLGNDELGGHVRESHYIIGQQCQPLTADGRAIRDGFTVTATPKIEGNPTGAPAYCVDQTKIIRRYADADKVNDATGVQHLTCPLDGEVVE